MRDGKSGEDGSVAFVYHGKFEPIAIGSFLSSGKNLNAGIKIKFWPKLEETEAWDFEDPPALDAEDDDFDLEAFLAED